MFLWVLTDTLMVGSLCWGHCSSSQGSISIILVDRCLCSLGKMVFCWRSCMLVDVTEFFFKICLVINFFNLIALLLCHFISLSLLPWHNFIGANDCPKSAFSFVISIWVLNSGAQVTMLMKCDELCQN